MVVITNIDTAPAIRSNYNGKEMKSVWLLNTEILCQKRGLSPTIFVSPIFDVANKCLKLLLTL